MSKTKPSSRYPRHHTDQPAQSARARLLDDALLRRNRQRPSDARPALPAFLGDDPQAALDDLFADLQPVVAPVLTADDQHQHLLKLKTTFGQHYLAQAEYVDELHITLAVFMPRLGLPSPGMALLVGIDGAGNTGILERPLPDTALRTSPLRHLIRRRHRSRLRLAALLLIALVIAIIASGAAW